MKNASIVMGRAVSQHAAAATEQAACGTWPNQPAGVRRSIKNASAAPGVDIAACHPAPRSGPSMCWCQNLRSRPGHGTGSHSSRSWWRSVKSKRVTPIWFFRGLLGHNSDFLLTTSVWLRYAFRKLVCIKKYYIAQRIRVNIVIIETKRV